MKTSPIFVFVLLGLLPGLSAAAEEGGGKPRARLISSELSGREVGFIRAMGESSVVLQSLAKSATKDLPPGKVANFAGSIVNALDEELTSLGELARTETVELPRDPSEAQRKHLKSLRQDGLTEGEFLAEVIKVRRDQLRAIQEVRATQSMPIRNFAGAMVKAIQDELIFIQLLSAKTQKEATENAALPRP